jgi:hypothetical protein
MTKQQAFEILNNAISQIQTTRQNHAVLLQALEVLLKGEKSE